MGLRYLKSDHVGWGWGAEQGSESGPVQDPANLILIRIFRIRIRICIHPGGFLCVLYSTLLHLPAFTDSTVSEDAGIEASAVEGRESLPYRVWNQ